MDDTSTVLARRAADVARAFGLLARSRRRALNLTQDQLALATGVEAECPLKRGARLTVRFGERVTGLEITELSAPTSFGWEEDGARRGSKTLFQLEAVGGSTRITVRHWWTPRSFLAWVRGRVLVKRRVERTLNAILRNVRNALN